MFCKKCGAEIHENAAYCVNCGEPVNTEPQQTEPVYEQTPEPVFMPEPENPYKNAIRGLLRDPLYLASCICVTVGAAVGVLSLSVFSLNTVFLILFSIFMWIVYTQAKKDTFADISLKNIRGTLKALKIVKIIEAVLLGISSIAIIAVSAFFGTVANLISWNEIRDEIASRGIDEVDEAIEEITEALGIGLTEAIKFLFILGAAVIVIALIISILEIAKLISPLQKFAGSFEGETTPQFPPQKLHNLCSWLIVFTVFSAIGTLGTISDGKLFIANAAVTVSYVLAYTLIKKHFFSR